MSAKLAAKALSALALISTLGALASAAPCPDGAQTCAASAAADEATLLQLASKQATKPRFAPAVGLLATRAELREVARRASPKDLRGLSPDQAVELSFCSIITCLNFLDPMREENCARCLYDWLSPGLNSEIGVNGIALGYATDMLSIPLFHNNGTNTYINAWCGKGGLVGCSVKKNFPGPGANSYMEWEDVWNIGKQYPAKQWSGEWWRGAELGFIMLTPVAWAGAGMWPAGLTIGVTPAQHAVLRPVLDDAFGTGKTWQQKKATQALITSMITKFFESRLAEGQLNIPEDLKAFQFQLLNKVALNRDVSWADALAFVSLQTTAAVVGAAGDFLPEPFYIFFGDLTKQYAQEVKALEPFVKNKYGTQLASQSCAPSKTSCLTLASTSVMDGLTFAGGISVPTDISAAVGLLYSTSPTNPYPAREIPPNKELEFFWENIRYFAPVVGFPVWSTRPTCPGLSPKETQNLNKPGGKQEACKEGPKNLATGYAKVNQWQGGTRQVPNIALAQRDPKKWGPTSNEFVVRNLIEYKKSVGFAEMAEDNTVAGGKMNRNCPGKTLALMIGETFLKLFKKGDWDAVSPESIVFGSGPTWVSGFVLKSVTTP